MVVCWDSPSSVGLSPSKDGSPARPFGIHLSDPPAALSSFAASELETLEFRLSRPTWSCTPVSRSVSSPNAKHHLKIILLWHEGVVSDTGLGLSAQSLTRPRSEGGRSFLSRRVPFAANKGFPVTGSQAPTHHQKNSIHMGSI